MVRDEVFASRGAQILTGAANARKIDWHKILTNSRINKIKQSQPAIRACSRCVRLATVGVVQSWMSSRAMF